MTRTAAAGAAALMLALALAGCGRAREDSGNTANAASPPISGTAVGDAIRAPSQAGQAAPSAPARVFTRHVDQPSDADMVMIYFDHIGEAPPIDRWAGDSSEVRFADEFKKQRLMAERAAALRTQFEHSKGVGSITFTASTELGEYSREFGEFHLSALAPGSGYGFSFLDSGVRLVPTNAAEFYRLPMDARRAEALAEKLYGRSARVEMQVTLDAARPELNGGVLEGHITKLRVLGADGTELSAPAG